MTHEIATLLEFLDEAFDKKSWHGPNLKGSIRGVDAQTAAWRPTPGNHNIWEYTLHAAYWKYVVRRRMTGDRRGSFPLKGSDFFIRPMELSESAWRQDIRILDDQHRALRRAISELTNKPGAKTLHMIRGAAAHDIYHAGQIRLLRRMRTAR